MRHQVSEKIGPWVNTAIDQHWTGGPIVWEPGLIPQQGQAVVACVFWIPGTTLGTIQQGSFLITNPLAVTKDEIDALVRDFLSQMRAAQSKDLVDDTPDGGPTQPLEERLSPEVEEAIVRGQRRASGLIVG